jgi:hypothetical protein
MRVHYEGFSQKRIVDTKLPVVCMRAHVLFMLFMLDVHSGVHVLTVYMSSIPRV